MFSELAADGLCVLPKSAKRGDEQKRHGDVETGRGDKWARSLNFVHGMGRVLPELELEYHLY
jgi:hypothetical protein